MVRQYYRKFEFYFVLLLYSPSISSLLVIVMSSVMNPYARENSGTNSTQPQQNVPKKQKLSSDDEVTTFNHEAEMKKEHNELRKLAFSVALKKERINNLHDACRKVTASLADVSAEFGTRIGRLDSTKYRLDGAEITEFASFVVADRWYRDIDDFGKILLMSEDNREVLVRAGSVVLLSEQAYPSYRIHGVPMPIGYILKLNVSGNYFVQCYTGSSIKSYTYAKWGDFEVLEVDINV